ncbi:hypothetical protein BC829DRAFT_383798 [Chytridium lagenaria]|nr:hypothetical protein BC829DRAFT_383798 [Chytridium lagenaria]
MWRSPRIPCYASWQLNWYVMDVAEIRKKDPTLDERSSIHGVVVHRTSEEEEEEWGKEEMSVEEKIRIAFELPGLRKFACWFVRSVLLKGYMYITENHICFYATLPTRDLGVIQKSGFLGKRPRTGTGFQTVTYWFTLKNDVLYYYEDSTSVYFPTGGIHLKDATRVEESKKRQNGFKIVTPRKKYYLTADTETSRKEWITALKSSIFHAATKVPTESSEEYFFSYFNDVDRAFKFIRGVWESRLGLARAAEEGGPRSPPPFPSTPVIKSPTKWTVNTQVNTKWPMVRSPSASFKPVCSPKRVVHHRRSESDHVLKMGEMGGSTSPVRRGDGENVGVMTPVRRGEYGKLGDGMVTRNIVHRRGGSDFVMKRGEGMHVKGSPQRVEHRRSESECVVSGEVGEVLPTVEEEGETKWGWRGHRKSMSDVSGFEGFVSSQKEGAFREMFAMPDDENLVAAYTCYLVRVLPRLGKIYVSEHYVCFQSKLVGIRTKVVIPDKQKELFYHGLCLLLKDQSEVYFEFHSSDLRNKCLEIISSRLVIVNEGAEKEGSPDRGQVDPRRHLAVLDDHPPQPPPSPMHITCLTIGTRGDVQPYIALCKRLAMDGHTCRIATHLEYKEWIEEHGIEFREVKGNPAELMQCCVDNGMFTVSFIRDAAGKFRGWIDELLESAWEACQGTDMLIESPTAMAGVHIAEKLDIPFFGAFSMPWTRTRAFPHPFAVTERHLGILWKGTSAQINRWRKKHPPIVLGNIGEFKIPYLYFFSPSIVPPPSDWHDWIHMTGFWFLDEPEIGWSPPSDLLAFLDGGPPPVYIGFGSIIVPDPDELTRTILAAVEKAGVRAVVSKGWSARMKEDGGEEEVIEFPEFVYAIDKVPHDWLFPRMAGVVHHGGCGTTGAGLRAGVPTAIRPFFGDQFFWADRVQDLGVGCAIRKLTVDKLASVLTALVSDEKMRGRAELLGSKIRAEDGVGNAAAVRRLGQSASSSLLLGGRSVVVDDDEQQGDDTKEEVGKD